MQTELAGSLATTASIFNATEYFRTAYYGPLQDEIEKNIRAAATATQPHDREGFFVKLISIGVMGYLYDMIWFTIYRSQLLFLLDLNHKNGLLPLHIAKTYYAKAVLDHPVTYEKYSFDQWMDYMKIQLLILVHPSDMIEITVRGKTLFNTYYIGAAPQISDLHRVGIRSCAVQPTLRQTIRYRPSDAFSSGHPRCLGDAAPTKCTLVVCR